MHGQSRGGPQGVSTTPPNSGGEYKISDIVSEKVKLAGLRNVSAFFGHDQAQTDGS